MNLPSAVLRRPVTTLMVLLSLMVLGLTAVARLPLAFMPRITEPSLEVQAQRNGVPSWVIEETVTRPLEEELAQLPGYRRIESETRWNRAEVELYYDWSEDMELKKAEVREAVERVRPLLPEDVEGLSVTAAQLDFGERATVSGRIASGRDLSASYQLLELKILKPLERIPGVANVEIHGVNPQRVNIELDPEALRRHGLTTGQVAQAVNAANVDLSAGVLRTEGRRMPLRSLASPASLQEARDLPLAGGVRLQDVATVELEEPPMWLGRHLNGNFAVGIDIMKEPTANTVAVVERIEKVVEQINADPAMQGIDFLIWHNEAEQIQKSLAGLRNAGVFGGLLAILVLYLFLKRLRTTLIVAVAIPFSLLTSCAFLYLLGRELNVMTLLGLMLGVGMLVDNSVVVVENIHRYREEGLPPREASRKGASEVTLAVTAATATTLCVWLPFLTGEPSEMGFLIAEVAVAMCLTIGSSLLVSLTFIPLAAARFLSADREPESGRIQRRLQGGYEGLLRFSLRHRILTLVGMVVLCGSVWLPYRTLEKTPEPNFREPDVNVRLEFAGTYPVERTRGVIMQLEEAFEPLRDELGFDFIYSYFGEGFGGIRVFWPLEEASEERLEQGARRLREAAPEIPGVMVRIGEESWRNRRWSRGGGERNQFPLVLRGTEMRFLQEKAAELEPVLLALPGVTGVEARSWGRTDELHVEVDPEAAGARGVTPQDVAQSINFGFQGRNLNRYRDGDQEVDVFLAVEGWEEEGWDRLLDLRVPGDGGEVALTSVADFRRVKGSNNIRKEDGKTSWTVLIQHAEGKGAEVRQAVRRRLQTVSFPEATGWELPQWNRQREEWSRLLMGFGLALLLVYIVMASLFESTTQPVAILVSLPLAGAGAFWILWLVGARFDLPAFIGCIVLVGIVVNNGIVLLDHVNQYRRKGRTFEESLVRGSCERLRPILMTALTTVIGLLPMALGRFTVANVYIDTMAWAVIGGLVSSTILTLLALPTWASLLHDLGVAIRRLNRATGGADMAREAARPAPEPEGA